MHRNSQSRDYRNHYSYVPRSRSISSRNTYQPFYDSRTHNQQLSYPSMTTIDPFPSSYLHEQPLTTIADLPEPMSLFDELGYIRSRRTNINPIPPVYVPSNRRTSGNVTRFTTANAMRERLLIDIQHNINEIDHELAVLDRRPVIPLYIPISFSTFHRKLPSSHHENRRRSIEPLRVYKVIPRIPGQTKKISSHSTPTRANHLISPPFVGQYHYGPEMEENEIRENDPENTDRNSVTKELSQLDFHFHKPLTLNEVRRKQSGVPDNRALIVVPAIAGTDEPEVIKKPDEPRQSKLVDAHTTTSSTSIKTSQEFSSTSKLNFRNFEPLIQNSLEQNQSTDNEVSDSTTNPMISKPVKYTSSSTQNLADVERPITPTRPRIFKSISSDNDIDGNATYIATDRTDGSVVPDALISVFPENHAPPTESELKTDDDIVENDANGHSKSKYTITNVYTSPLSPTTPN